MAYELGGAGMCVGVSLGADARSAAQRSAALSLVRPRASHCCSIYGYAHPDVPMQRPRALRALFSSSRASQWASSVHIFVAWILRL